MKEQKIIFVTGGVVSSLGKGISSASIATLLESRGIAVSILKLDPYLNVDPGTMNPYEHGEVYVTDDGSETDLDLGHYYRFTNSPIDSTSNATSGQVYETVIRKERKGDYLGKTVQVIPHITNEIKRRIDLVLKSKNKPDVLIVEIGGTVGDIESQPYLEAIRQLRLEKPSDCMNIHMTYVPYLSAAAELKTKPSQHSVQMLRSIGIVPEVLLCRSPRALDDDTKRKIGLFCSVSENLVFSMPDLKSIYEVPLYLHQQKLDNYVLTLLNLEKKPAKLSKWETVVRKQSTSNKSVTIAVVGKYLKCKDAYLSIFEALSHSGIHLGCKVETINIESDQIQNGKDFPKVDGLLIPGAFGSRGIEGKILAASYARRKKIPYLGICMGMQVLVIEYARNVLGWNDANTSEIDQRTPYPVISLIEEQKSLLKHLGATMRLGAYDCNLKKGSHAFEAYKKKTISERHRHRYEFNQDFLEDFQKKGLHITGTESKSGLCEVVEVEDHPWMVGVQYHPEFKSKPIEPHPLFNQFITQTLKTK